MAILLVQPLITNMGKHYIISISKLVDTFSRVIAGKEFDFTLSTSDSTLSDSTISKNDFLLVSIDDKVYYQFKVINKTEEEIRLKKIFEIEKSIGHRIDEEGVFQEITLQEHNTFCQNLFSDYSGETPLKNNDIDLGDLKEGFADWLFKQGKYQRVYKSDKAVLIEKLSEYEKAYENDFGIGVFDFPNLSLETIIGE